MITNKQKNLKRENHYVPQWYQRGFNSNKSSIIMCLELNKTYINKNSKKIKINTYPRKKSIESIFKIKDLYTTSFGTILIDEIEDKFFGKIDSKGSKAVKAFIENEPEYVHKRFQDFFEFMDIQKLRTPKGLDWIKQQYSHLDKNSQLIEMQALSKQYITIWTEGVREIVSAKNSDTKFIFSDHPITTYNHAIPLDDLQNTYPNDPSITLKGTQTIFSLNQDYCLILTNYEYADDIDSDSLEKRTNSSLYRESFVNTLDMIRERDLEEDDVRQINYIIKQRAVNFIAGANKEWLCPEKYVTTKEWHEFRNILRPPHTNHFGGEMYMGYDDGTTRYQDAFGRSTPQNKYLLKDIDESKLESNDECGCGSGKSYKNCCKNKDSHDRPSWKELSIRERNLIFCNAIIDIIGLSEEKSWEDIRKELNEDQVKDIYELYSNLWPLDTNIIDLLPKPDNRLRILYTGIVEAETIETTILNLTMYFDEVIVQNPITHPSRMTDEFSPIKVPHKHLQQTLKYIFFMLKAYPFIENGSILLIPDLTEFNKHLDKSSIDMSHKRFNEQNIDIHSQDTTLIQQQQNNIMSSYLGLPEYQLKEFIRSTQPEIDDVQLIQIAKLLKQSALLNPLVLLQENIFKEGSQFQSMHFLPIPEISLLLCQITGALLITDSHTRWEEIKRFQVKELGLTTYKYTTLTKIINTYNFMFNQNAEQIFENRDQKSLINIRNVYQDFYNLIFLEESRSKKKIKNLKSRFKKEYVNYLNNKKTVNQNECKIKLEFLIPNNGFVSTNVQRLLIQNGCNNNLKNLPIAIFIKKEEQNE